MSADQTLAVATNALCVIAFCAPAPVNAAFIAEQISLNPVVVRRALGKMVAAGLVKSIQGASGGYILLQPTSDISLQDVFDALSSKGIFERSNAFPKASCDEGKMIGIAIAGVFARAEGAFANVLRETTLADVLKTAVSD